MLQSQICILELILLNLGSTQCLVYLRDVACPALIQLCNAVFVLHQCLFVTLGLQAYKQNMLVMNVTLQSRINSGLIADRPLSLSCYTNEKTYKRSAVHSFSQRSMICKHYLYTINEFAQTHSPSRNNTIEPIEVSRTVSAPRSKPDDSSLQVWKNLPLAS